MNQFIKPVLDKKRIREYLGFTFVESESFFFFLDYLHPGSSKDIPIARVIKEKDVKICIHS